jgi:hypothetical protein
MRPLDNRFTLKGTELLSRVFPGDRHFKAANGALKLMVDGA